MEENKYYSELTACISKLLEYTINEPILFKNIEQFLSPKPVLFANNDKELKALENNINKLIHALGAPFALIIHSEDQIDKNVYDEYGTAAISEIINCFHGCRYAVIKSHLMMIAKCWIEKKPEVIFSNKAEIEKYNDSYIEIIESRFWQETENSYIRLASFWDRVGQLLAFMFFNIRQYDREGFSSIFDKIHSNFYPIYSRLSTNESYKKLREFQTSEKQDGLKWLLKRRNILIHSLRLRKYHYDDPIPICIYNHLEDKLKNSLKPSSEKDEVGYLHTQLRQCAELLHAIIELSFLSIDLRLHVAVHE